MTWLRDRLPYFYRDAEGYPCLEWQWDRHHVVTIFCYRWGIGYAYIWGNRRNCGVLRKAA